MSDTPEWLICCVCGAFSLDILAERCGRCGSEAVYGATSKEAQEHVARANASEAKEKRHRDE